MFTFGLGRKNCVRFGSFQISQVLILFEYRCAAWLCKLGKRGRIGWIPVGIVDPGDASPKPACT